MQAQTKICPGGAPDRRAGTSSAASGAHSRAPALGSVEAAAMRGEADEWEGRDWGEMVCFLRSQMGLRRHGRERIAPARTAPTPPLRALSLPDTARRCRMARSASMCMGITLRVARASFVSAQTARAAAASPLCGGRTHHAVRHQQAQGKLRGIRKITPLRVQAAPAPCGHQRAMRQPACEGLGAPHPSWAQGACPLRLASPRG